MSELPPLDVRLPADGVSVRRTVTEADVLAFAELSGDRNRVHTDAAYMAGTRFGGRLVHGAFLLALVSTASTRLIEETGGFAVAYGHDRVRYLAPTFLDDTVTVHYRPAQVDAASGKVTSEVEVHNQHGDLVTVGTHTVWFLPENPDERTSP
ncbi:MaoC family dehydratase [Nocardioides sp. LHG3406-4]|uniref:MaoC family dehydratase n=1 Tax=Nocardioides sp. LHG3406-4 TaxID=2804575 RepID=UPI003CF1BBC7